MRQKFYALFALLVLSLGILAGCGSTTEKAEDNKSTEGQTEQAAFPVTIKDALDNEVVIEEEPTSIISLIPSNTEIIYELGLGDKVVGLTTNDTYPEETAEVEKVGDFNIDVEKVIALNPDLVLAHESSATSSEAGFQQMRDAGIAVFIVNDAVNFEDVYDTIGIIGQLTGTTEAAEALTADMKAKIDEIKEKAATVTEKKKVYIEISPSPDIYSVGKNTFMDVMLQTINAENATGDLDGWPSIDQESILERNPDVIIATYNYIEDPVGQLMAREGWADVSAIKNKQVVAVNPDLVNRPGPRVVEGVEELAKAVYPEVFNN
ncbi:ABC transporter substrate-binding protein [Robertmurraya korlensis]|uniref:ABC transporter substrate-binding protein n=1 Tax=Robertmurraya korlensis TaxID=519977 RepID=UPI00203C4864|nr:ABC transporter substrate-binding protein [Robertmurraya korlensis]MCM3603258.1 ABC transporter substrate-binding protein [Robertmurraya korlensis]